MNARHFELPAFVEQGLERYLKDSGGSLETIERHAADIRFLSDHFTRSEGARTPWDQANAYMVYYFPLNLVRLKSALSESFREFPWSSVTGIIDFGSGPGTVQAAFEDSALDAKPITAVEIDRIPIAIHKSFAFAGWPCTWRDQLPAKIAPGTLGVFSYSLLEDETVIKRLNDFDHLLIVSPSTRSQGRRLLEIRKDMTAKGFFSWAPCTHQQACPLLSESKTDWCHDRIMFDAPAWYRRLESHLPFYNHSLTYSYWFASRTENPVAQSGRARVTGDTLYEKGKVRQMICRGPRREFLGWLTRDGEAPQIPRGSLVQLPEALQLKGNELRGFIPS